MEDILAIILIFGGGTAVLLSFSPIGRALAERILHGKQSLPAPELDAAVYEELDMLRRDMVEVQERLDFAERLLTDKHDSQLKSAGEPE